jgi:hypothetical protein
MMTLQALYVTIMHVKPFFLLLTLSAALASCGGGGGGSGYTITGVAASGAAIVHGTVEVRCQVGGGSVETETDGSYRIHLPDAQGPCLLRAIDSVTGIELHSALEEAPAQSVAHITPLSDLVVAKAVRAEPATAFADPANYLRLLSPISLSVGMQAAREAAAAVGTPLPEGLDPLKGQLQTATAEAQGSIMDRAIDTLMATLASADQALSELARRVAVGGGLLVGGGGGLLGDGGGPIGGGDPIIIDVNVPVGGDVRSVLDGLVARSLQALPGCPAARGARVWLIDALSGQPPQGHELSLGENPGDIAQLIRLDNGAASEIRWDLNEPCVFRADDKTFRISDNGMGIWNSAAAWGVIVPMQGSVDLTAPSFSGQYGALALMQGSHNGIDFTPAAAFDFRINAPGRPLIEGRQCAINMGSSTALPACSGLNNAFALAFQATQCREVLVPYETAQLRSGALRCVSREGNHEVEAHVMGYNAGGSSTLLITLNNYPLSATDPSVRGRGMVVLNKVSRPMVLPQVTPIADGAFWETGYDPTAAPRFFSAPVAQSSLSRLSSSSYQQTRGSVTYTHHLDTPARGLLWSRSGNAGVMIRLSSPAGWSFAAEKVEIPALAGLGDVYRHSAQVRKPSP